MEKIRLAVLCPSEIAFRRFMPALQQVPQLEFVGLGAATEDEWCGNGSSIIVPAEQEKAERFTAEYGGIVFPGYEGVLASADVDAVYLPLPPGLHYHWGKKVLEHGKHLLMEKPFTTSAKDTRELLRLAGEKGLAVHENYMFVYHSQLSTIQAKLAHGELGELRLCRMSFGFPKRAETDFRYNKALGGGALLDCGGYPIRLAQMLLGNDLQVVQSKLSQPAGHDVDLYGNAVLENSAGLCAQISFGMDNAYQCQLELWGSQLTLIAPRVFTAGPDLFPPLILRSSSGEETVSLPPDNSFLHSIQAFVDKMQGKQSSDSAIILHQAELVDAIRRD